MGQSKSFWMSICHYREWGCTCVQRCVHVHVCTHLWMINVRSRSLVSEIITGNASWILAYSCVMKCQSSEWNTNMLSPKEKVVSYHISAEGHCLTTLYVTPWVCPCRTPSDFHVFTSKLWSVGEMPFGRGSLKKRKNYWILHHDFGSFHTCLMQQLSCIPLFHLPSQPPYSAYLSLCDFWPLDWRMGSKAIVLCLSGLIGITQEVFASRGRTAEAIVCVCVCVYVCACMHMCTCSMRGDWVRFYTYPCYHKLCLSSRISWSCM